MIQAAHAICPGGINMSLLHRGDPDGMARRLAAAQPWPEHGRPEDIAGAVAWLASGDVSVLESVVGLDQGSTGRAATAEPIS